MSLTPLSPATRCRVGIILATCLIFGILDFQGLLIFLVLLPLPIAFSLSIGFFLAPFSVLLQDLYFAVQVTLRPFMFVSGAIIPLPATGPYSWLMLYNPFAILIENFRNILTLGEFWSVEHLIFIGVLTVPMIFLSLYVFGVGMKSVAQNV